MGNEHILLLLILIFSFFLLKSMAGANDDCLPASCGPLEPEVRFPFRIIGRQPARCGFPGFDLSCDKKNKTILQLPLSLSYIVNNISYLSQVISINPEFCRPNRIVSVNPTATPFRYIILQSYTFYNCALRNLSIKFPHVPIPCLTSGNYSVFAALTGSSYPVYMLSICTAMKTIMVPVGWNNDTRESLDLMWFTPYCRPCERKGQACRLKSDGGQTFCAGSSSSFSKEKGISRSAKYRMIIGISVPALIGAIIGFACYASSKVQDHNDSHNQSINPAIIPRPASITGLDGATIESYPKTVFGDRYSLSNDDGTCAVCLCDYKPKESLRTIPECNHYFHAECIDKWLKLNATCPLCRNTPESSVLVTPCSSASLSTSIDS